MKILRRIWNSDKAFLIVDYILLGLLLLVVLYPLLYVVMASFAAGGNLPLYLIPKRFSLEGYKAVFEYRDVWVGFKNSFINVILCVAFELTVTMLCAYPLSRPDFKGKKIVTFLCVFTMYFENERGGWEVEKIPSSYKMLWALHDFMCSLYVLLW